MKEHTMNAIDDSLTSAATPTAGYKDATSPVTMGWEKDKIRLGKTPTGYYNDANDPNKIIPFNLASGGTYQDLQTERMQTNKATPGWGQPEQLNLAINRDNRDQQRLDAQDRKDEERLRIQDNKDAIAAFKQDQADWKLDHPTYNKDMADIQKSGKEHEMLVKSVENYKKVLGGYDQISRHNPAYNAALQTAYQAITWPARSESMSNTGVMNVGEYPMLNQLISNPTDWSLSGIRSKEELIKQLDEFVNVSKVGHEALVRKLTPDTHPPTMRSAPNPPKIESNAPTENIPESRATPNENEIFKHFPSNAPIGSMYKDYVKTDSGITQVKPGDIVIINGKKHRVDQ
jgi:hypothetical protein